MSETIGQRSSIGLHQLSPTVKLEFINAAKKAAREEAIKVLGSGSNITTSSSSGSPTGSSTPLPHALTHLAGGSDAIDWSGRIHAQGVLTSRPTADGTNSGYFYIVSDEDGGTIYRSNGSQWVKVAKGAAASTAPSGPAGGDLGGTYPNPTVLQLQGDVLPTKLANSFLKRNSGNTAWEEVTYGSVANSVCQGNDSRLSDSRNPNGSAGGDLTGTYPNPTLTATGVTAGTYGDATHIPQFTVDAKGRITGATSFTFSGLNTVTVRSYQSTGQSIPNNSATAAVWNVSDYDTDTMHTGATWSVHTINTAAKFIITGQVALPRYAFGSVILSVILTRSGVDTTIGQSQPQSAPPGLFARDSDILVLQVTAHYDLLVGDTIKLVILQKTGTSLTTTAGTGSTWFAAAAQSPRGPQGATGAAADDASVTVKGISKLSYAPASATNPIAVGDNDPRVPTQAENDALVGTNGSPSGSNKYVTDSDSRNTNSRSPNGAASGDLSGTYPSPTVTGLQGSALPTATANGFLKRNNGNTGWEEVTYGSAANTVTQGNDSRLSDSRTPTGSAGGDLTGTYPNPTLVATAVTAGLYGDGTHVAQFTVDAKGRITGASNTLITGAPPTGSASGDLGGSYPSPTVLKAQDGFNVTALATNGGMLIQGLINDLGLRVKNTGTGGVDWMIDSSAGASSYGQGALTFSYARTATGFALRMTSALVDFFNGAVAFNSSGTMTAGTVTNARLDTTGVTATTYGDASHVPQFIVNAQGRITSVTSVLISGVAPAGAASGDLSGSYPSPTVTGLQGNALPTAATNGFLKRNSANTAWEEVGYGSAANTVTQGNDSRLSDSRTPTGAASGDLSGTYPSPSVSGLQSNALPIKVNGGFLKWNAGGTAWEEVGYGSASNTVCQGNDSRLSDSRTPTGTASGDLTGTYPSPTLTTTGVTANTYGDGTHVGQFTVDVKGRITSASAVLITGAAPTGSASGDLGGSYPSPTVQGLKGSALPTSVADGFIKRNAANTAWEEIGYGSAANTVCQGNDSRLSNSRTPTAHASTHLPNGSDAIDWAGTILTKGVASARPTAGVTNTGTYYTATDTNGGTTYRSDGSTWIQIAKGVTEGSAPTGTASGDLSGSYPSPTVTGLQGNVLPSTVANGFLKRNSANTAWEEVSYGSAANTVTQGNDSRLSDSRTPSGSASGDLGGSYPSPTVQGLKGDVLPTNIANGFLKRNAANSAWEQVAYGTVANSVCQGNDSRLSDSRIPTGSAGGDLGGTYPNPTVPMLLITDFKQSVRVATTAALPANTLSGNVLTMTVVGAFPTQDGITLSVGDRILVKNEGTGADNGIYTLTNAGSVSTQATLTRATDADTSAKVTSGMYSYIEEGTTNGKVWFNLTTINPITLNTTALVFAQQTSAALASGPAGGDLGGTYPNPTVLKAQDGFVITAISANGGQLIQGATDDIGVRLKNTGTGGVDWFIDSTAGGSGYGTGALAFSYARTGTGIALRMTASAADFFNNAMIVDNTGTMTAGAVPVGRITGTLPVGNGGTGTTTFTSHGVLLGNGGSAIGTTAAGTAGQILRSGGASADPAYSTATYPSTAGTSGNKLTSDGTNIVSLAQATTLSTPSNPSGTTSSSGVMMGLAGSITPTSSGKVLIIISGRTGNSSTSLAGVQFRIRHGTGTAPTNGAALTGSAVGALNNSEGASGDQFPFCQAAVVTGMSLNVAHWIDMEVGALIAGTAAVNNVTITAIEL